jgi:hypothetical protein
MLTRQYYGFIDDAVVRWRSQKQRPGAFAFESRCYPRFKKRLSTNTFVERIRPEEPPRGEGQRHVLR